LISEEKSGGAINVSPALSPDGQRLAFFSERDAFSIDIYIADARPGEVQEKITETAVDPHFDSMQFVNSAGAWSADGRRFAFGSIRSGRPVIAIYDLQSDEVTERITLGELGEVFSPTWSPTASELRSPPMKAE
jgi:Tol biopolymer transport system component